MKTWNNKFVEEQVNNIFGDFKKEPLDPTFHVFTGRAGADIFNKSLTLMYQETLIDQAYDDGCITEKEKSNYLDMMQSNDPESRQLAMDLVDVKREQHEQKQREYNFQVNGLKDARISTARQYRWHLTEDRLEAVSRSQVHEYEVRNAIDCADWLVKKGVLLFDARNTLVSMLESSDYENFILAIEIIKQKQKEIQNGIKV